MLNLTRYEREALMIGDEVKVQVLGVKGHQVKLGIAAPRSVPVVRDELLRKKPNR